MRILPLNTRGEELILFDNIYECTEYCLYKCIQKFGKYPEPVQSKIPYNINYKKIDRLYRGFKKAYKNIKEGILENNYIKISTD
jgi:hypothetical protein